MIEALDIQVKGIVQGVGFRPFVYRLAKKYLICGWVLNASDGVFIHAEAESKLLDEFVIELSENPPAASRVEEVSLKEVPLEDFTTFEIRFSDASAKEKTTLVSPDLATCDDCSHELFDTTDRRFRYPFINCTNCGPRFTIIDKLPYDRKNTSMGEFPLCPLCEEEYNDPLNRRFHAQPNACFECGPHISWREHTSEDIESPLSPPIWGKTLQESDGILARAVECLLEGKILAVKGLGGFHLVCDANNPKALATLRERKRREGKAFAVMLPSLDEVRSVCQVNDVEADTLMSSQRPIVLLRKKPEISFAQGLADSLGELGVMLPYTPLQHLLLSDFEKAYRSQAAGTPMLVMTSGNIHDEPIVTDDAEAEKVLFSVADAFMGNNRAIRARYDDSVVRVIEAGSAGFALQFLRRARGYAPLPLTVDEKCAVQNSERATEQVYSQEHVQTSSQEMPQEPGQDVHGTSDKIQEQSLFAAGPEQKNTFTLMRDNEAFVSQHIGDMENAETYDAWLTSKTRYEQLFEINPQSLACDAHPEYLPSKWARQESEQRGLPLLEVQHHHAHIASVLGEQGLYGPVCGIAFDGTGFGLDGSIWGGEVLVANTHAFERFMNFAYIPMPGGAAAVKNPLRMAYGVLWAFDLLNHEGAADALRMLGQQAVLCDQMIEKGINTPLTSSVGRLFDAASALLGICTNPSYEGEPAILLEAALYSDGYNDEACSCHTSEPLKGKVAYCDQNRNDSQQESSWQNESSHEVAARYAIDLVKNTATSTSTAQDTSVVLFDAAPTFTALLDDMVTQVPRAEIAKRFHQAFVDAVVAAAELVRGLYEIETVALAGGVFMNRFLIENSLRALENAGFTVAINRDLPPNDGSVSFGQAVIAWATNNSK